jgi:hypothetical protein
LIDILNQIHTEQWPNEVIPGTTQLVSSTFGTKEWHNYVFNLYVKYINISKQIEDSYDQLSHPQLRKIVKQFLENILCRIVQLKKEILYFNNPFIEKAQMIYQFLDNSLIDFKFEPEAINLVIPRYFIDDLDEVKKRRNILLSQRLKENSLDVDPEVNFPKRNHFKFEIKQEDAVKFIQIFELGRQNLKRVNDYIIANKKVDNDFLIGGEDKKFMEDERKKIA